METAAVRTGVGQRRSARRRGRYGLTVALLAVACAAGVLVGKAPLDPATVLAVLISRLPFVDVTPWWPASYETILIDIRIPRVVMGALVGAALSVAGATYQGLFRNPLADPYLVGVAAGAGLGAAIAMALPLPPLLYALGIVQISAFISAVITVFMVYSLSRVGGSTPVTTLLLAGVAMGSLASAGTSFIMYAHGDKIAVIYGWMLGSFNISSWQQIGTVAPYVLVATAVLSLMGRTANVLQLDDDQAKSLGLNVERIRLVLVGAATLATAAAVSASGLIGFVGLAVPHVVRMLWGPDHRSLIPLSALVGAIFLVTADTGARMIPGPQEIPVGIITAFCGAPFFIYLLRQQKRSVF